MPMLTSHLTVTPGTSRVKIDTVGDALHVDVPSNEKVTLIERYDSLPNATSTNSRIQVSVAPNAHVTHYKLVLENPQVEHHSSLEAIVQRDATFESHVFLMGGRHVRNTIQVRLQGDNANCTLNGLYIAAGQQIMETNTLIEHQKPHGTSREFYKGILDDESQGMFDGLIVVAKDAQKTDSAQVNKNLLLSAKAKARSLPDLKILANDVKCKHGSTIGQLEPSHLFYLRSRGIPLADARRLLIYAFASEMIEMVELEDLRNTLLSCLTSTTFIKK
jgi:Fe-S cluster assembly protein SufD